MQLTFPGVVVFDLDGTLVDSAPDLQACANQLLAELGLPALGLAQVTSFVGEGIPPLIARCLSAAGRSTTGVQLDAAIGRYKQIYAAAPARHSRLYDGVLDCLERLQERQVKLGVCTNKSESLARTVLAALRLDKYFPAVVGGDTLATRKPDAAPLLHTVRLLEAGIGDTVYVGDSEIDAAAAVAAGLPFALFTRGYRKLPVEQLTHAVRFNDFGALAELLAGLVRKP